MKNIQIAIDYFGSQAALARALGVDPMAVTQWKKRGLPPRRALQIAECTNWKIKPGDLLPEFARLVPSDFEATLPEPPVDKRKIPDRRDNERRIGDRRAIGRRSPDRRSII